SILGAVCRGVLTVRRLGYAAAHERRPGPARDGSDRTMPSMESERRTWPPRIDRLPRGLSILIGPVAVLAGVGLATRPLTSLQALGWYLGLGLLVLGTAGLVELRSQPLAPQGTTGRWGTVRIVTQIS